MTRNYSRGVHVIHFHVLTTYIWHSEEEYKHTQEHTVPFVNNTRCERKKSYAIKNNLRHKQSKPKLGVLKAQVVEASQGCIDGGLSCKAAWKTHLWNICSGTCRIN